MGEVSEIFHIRILSEVQLLHIVMYISMFGLCLIEWHTRNYRMLWKWH